MPVCVGAAASDSCRRFESLAECETFELLNRCLLEEAAAATLAGDLVDRLEYLVRHDHVCASHDHLRQVPLLVTLYQP